MKSSHAQSLADHLQRSDQYYYLITDTKGILRQINLLFSKKTGFSIQYQSQGFFSDILIEDHKERCNEMIEECLTHPHQILNAYLVCQGVDGSLFNTKWELSVLFNNDDSPEGIQWIGTEETTDKNSIRRNNLELWERYEAYEDSAEGLWKMNLKTPVSMDQPPEQILQHCLKYGYIGACNDKLARMYGFEKAGDLIGVSLEQMMDMNEPVLDLLKELIAKNFHSANVESKEFDRDGNTLYFLNNMTGIIENGFLKRIWGTQFDITEKKKAEQQLQQSELFYRNLIADSLDGMLLTDNMGNISFASASVKTVLGYEPEEITGKNALEFVHPDDRPTDIPGFYEEIKQSPGSKFINARLMQKSGEWLWCMVRGHNLLANPVISAMLIYFCDDTLRKKAETALIESEQRFRRLIHDLNLGVILVNEKGEIMISNKATSELMELSEEQLMGFNVLQTPMDIIHEDGHIFPSVDFPVAIAIQTKTSVRNVVMGIKRANTDDRLWLLVSAEPVLDTRGDILHVISCFTDISDQKRLSLQLIDQEIQKQKQLMQATIDGQENERREIGRELHDNISQHLTTTRLYLEVAKDKAEGEALTMISKAHKGLLDIVSEIRQISQSLVPPSLSDIGLIESIEDLCEPLKTTHTCLIDFQHHQFDEDLLPDNMKLMLFRIIQEQVNNIVRHSNTREIFIRLQTIHPRVILSVADNGKGFDPATIKKGLGFDNISNRVSLFGGKFTIDAAPGKGCAIYVTIPIP